VIDMSVNGSSPEAGAAVEHLDVLIVGAGLSGIGTACHLRIHHPQRSIALLESRDASGGTWDLFRYPGIRSDSDMFTLGYSFRPWADDRALADGDTIRDYIRETARDYGVEPLIRYGRRVVAAEWSSEDARWTVEAVRDGGEREQLTCSWLFCCTGYYRYDEGYAPRFAGSERFGGEIVHPQHWDEDLDFRGKRVVVIGSGATAVTVVPAMARDAAHVTMLQRSPTYVLAMPARDPIAGWAQQRLPGRLSHPLIRWISVIRQWVGYQLSRRRPELMKRLIRRDLEKRLPADFDIDTHFTPTYQPWDQRLCLAPDGDLFKAISSGDASVVTDRIDRFVETGIRLESGTVLEADVIVTATGLNLLALGGIELTVDGRRRELPGLIGYKGLMLGGVPNLALTLGYTNASWTLKCDLTAQYVCRLLDFMDRHGYRVATPRVPGPEVERVPFLDLEAGYVMRAIDDLPKQGPKPPWRLHQNYARDIVMLRHRPVDDEAMSFGR